MTAIRQAFERATARRAILLGMLAAALTTWWFQRQPTAPDSLHLIAHALGGIDGRVYTNAEDAFLLNYNNGFRIFEVDLLFLADRTIAAFHSLDSVSKEFGSMRHISGLTQPQFLSHKVFGQYQVMTLPRLVQLAKKYPDARFVLDFKDSSDRNNDEDLQHDRQAYADLLASTTGVIGRRDSALLEQFIPQIYCEEDLEALNRIHPFSTVIYTLYRTSDSDQKVFRFVNAKKGQIRYVAFSKARFSEPLVRELAKIDVRSLVYTINNLREMENLQTAGAYGFYTDFIIPSQ